MNWMNGLRRMTAVGPKAGLQSRQATPEVPGPASRVDIPRTVTMRGSSMPRGPREHLWRYGAKSASRGRVVPMTVNTRAATAIQSDRRELDPAAVELSLVAHDLLARIDAARRGRADALGGGSHRVCRG